MYEEMINDVTSLKSAVIELEDKKNNFMLKLNDNKLAVRDRVETLKTRLQERIKEIAAALMSEIDKLHKDLLNEAADDIEKIRDRRKKIQNISEQFE